MTKRRSKKNKNEPLLIAAIVVLVLALAVGVYVATRSTKPPGPPPPPPPPPPPVPAQKTCKDQNVKCKSGTSRGMDDTTCTTCKEECCQAWSQYIENFIIKELPGISNDVLNYVKEICPSISAETALQIYNDVKTYLDTPKATRKLSQLKTALTKTCKPPSPPAADISQGGLIGGCAGTRYGCCADGVTSAPSDNAPCKRMLGGLVPDSRCASGIAISGTFNPDTRRPFCKK